MDQPVIPIAVTAAALLAPTVTAHKSKSLCPSYKRGDCRRGHLCQWSHETSTSNSEQVIKSVSSLRNALSLEDRAHTNPFEQDGPAELSCLGSRHDNDQIDIQNIRILPTTDEMLCRRPPYMPSRLPSAKHHLPIGQSRLLDTNFRQLRYENTEYIIDCCYHASQTLYISQAQSQFYDYEYRFTTPKGNQYHLFHDLAFEDIQFHETKGIMLRMSYACPEPLRGRSLSRSKILEEGMLVCLIGLDRNSLSTTFMEVHLRQSTDAMRKRSGNDTRGNENFHTRLVS